MIDAIKTAGVLGLGVMGFDIAFLYAQKGYRTLVFDASPAAMDRVAVRRDQTIERLKRRNRISESEAENLQGGLIGAPDLASLAGAELITEAVSESGKTKRAAYRELRESGFTGILTTNTSSLTRASLTAEGEYPRGKFATTHFFNPVLHTQMVEVVRGDMANPHYTVLSSFLADLERKPVETRDISGFVSNSVLMVYAVTALRLLESGAAIEEVDGAAKELRALPPLFSFDSWKPSIVEDVTRVMHESRGEEFLRSSKLLTALAKSNELFYVEQKPNPAVYELIENRRAGLNAEMIKRALTTSVRLAAARTVELGETPATVDFVAVEGLKFPRGPLAEMDEMGAAAVLKDLQAVNRAMGQDGMKATDLLMAMAERHETFFREGQNNPWIAEYAGGRGHASH